LATKDQAEIKAGVVELADTQVLEACAARRAGSSPAPGIKSVVSDQGRLPVDNFADH
jgi:hypothetical protein